MILNLPVCEPVISLHFFRTLTFSNILSFHWKGLTHHICLQGCYKELSQSGWFKTTEIYSDCAGSHKSERNVLAGHFLQTLPGKACSVPGSRRLQAVLGLAWAGFSPHGLLLLQLSVFSFSVSDKDTTIGFRNHPNPG